MESQRIVDDARIGVLMCSWRNLTQVDIFQILHYVKTPSQYSVILLRP